ncbi:MAG: hypothetical protein WDZ94_05245 [Patescibacteria group bacterium]
MKIALIISKTLLVFLLSCFIFETSIQAQETQHVVAPECQGVAHGECNSQGYICRLVEHQSGGVATLQQSTNRCGPGSVGSSVLGGVRRPSSVNLFNVRTDGTGDGIGIVLFISNLLTLFTIIAGIWVMFNILRAAYMFISSAGDTGTYEKVRELLTTSVIGVTIIASAYILAGLIGWIIFGDPTFILRPTLSGAV